jgi:hypothetical protein
MALQGLSLNDGQRVVFWNDPEKEFLSTVPYMNIETVTVQRRDTVSALGVKRQFERLPHDQTARVFGCRTWDCLRNRCAATSLHLAQSCWCPDHKTERCSFAPGNGTSHN